MKKIRTYIEQDKPLGLAHAVLVSNSFLKGDPFVMYLGDNMFEDSLDSVIAEFDPNLASARLLLARVEDPSAFGVAQLDINGRVVELTEKPEAPLSDLALVGDVKFVLEKFVSLIKKKYPNFENSNKQQIAAWWSQIENWRKKNSLGFKNSREVIKPQYAVQRLYELTKAQDVFITTEVGQHQMWAAQHYKFDKPNRWMTSGGLGTMGYGLPAAVGVQVANPDKLVIDIAGEASVLMTMQEMSTAVQYKLPIKIFILNNEYMGMVRQWQELLHDKNYSESYTAALPDFVKLAEAYGCVGIRANKPEELDEKIAEMLSVNRPVIFDCVVDKAENCYPMIPSGKPHNQMLLGEKDEDDEISEAGKVLV